MNQPSNRSKSQRRAETNYDQKRAQQPRFGGRCSVEEKEQLQRLCQSQQISSEKEMIFKALDYFEKNH